MAEWKCAGCGALSPPDRARVCGCATEVVIREVNGKHEQAWKQYINGVGRMPDNDRAALVMLKFNPSDDDLRSLHDHMKEWRP